jgi:hypothetical protein
LESDSSNDDVGGHPTDDVLVEETGSFQISLFGSVGVTTNVGLDCRFRVGVFG